jgi:exonuclease VII small subunit
MKEFEIRFKDFITRQRVGILVIGCLTFVISLMIAKRTGYATISGALFIDLAASATTVVFTALIIDYLGVREEASKTKNAAGLAEDEIRATCFRVKWRMARLFGLQRNRVLERENISNRQQAKEYLDKAEQEVNDYLNTNDLLSSRTTVHGDKFVKYLERLESARSELEQTLMLYQYAMSYSLRERALSLRTELQIADNVLGFIDLSDDLNDANISIIRVLSKSIYEAVESLLEHDSQITNGTPLHAKESRL